MTHTTEEFGDMLDVDAATLDEALGALGELYGGATAFPQARGVWRDDERGGVLVEDQPVVIHSLLYDARRHRRFGSSLPAWKFLPTNGTRGAPRRNWASDRR